ncbi:hypothetical protein D9Q98_007601 [Chlorella vulgaris]|uniref:Dof-type domain-containing protein n=1 Tax=Chlorella vulgaris TaxID=3077 RepID=A0A9D4TMD0_CHLVU|nr:hypothetical protein D9Q98_007601 [Chlorella vulgaris]
MESHSHNGGGGGGDIAADTGEQAQGPDAQTTEDRLPVAASNTGPSTASPQDAAAACGEPASGEPASARDAQPADAAAAAVGKDRHKLPKPEGTLACPRCESENTKFCYYNNYNIKQPRYFCRGCQRYWTVGGTLRDVPVGAGKRRNKPASSVVSPKAGKRGSAAKTGDEGAAPAAAAAAAGAAGAGSDAMTAVSLHAMSLPLQLQLPIPNPNSSMPAIVPFLDPALAAYGLAPGVLPSVAYAPALQPIVDPAAIAAAAAAAAAAATAGSQLAGGAPPTALASAAVPQPVPAAAPPPSVAAPAASQNTSAAEPEAGPEKPPSGDNEPEQPQKRLKAEGGAMAAVAAVAAAAAANGGELPQPPSLSPGLAAPFSAVQHAAAAAAPSEAPGVAPGHLPADWYTTMAAAAHPQHTAHLHAAAAAAAAHPQHMAHLHAAAATAALAGHPYTMPGMWPPFGSAAYGSMPHWAQRLAPSHLGVPPHAYLSMQGADSASSLLAAVAASAALAAVPHPGIELPAGMPPHGAVPWAQPPVVSGALGALANWGAVPVNAAALGGVPSVWGGGLSAAAPPPNVSYSVWAAAHLPAANPLAAAAAGSLNAAHPQVMHHPGLPAGVLAHAMPQQLVGAAGLPLSSLGMVPTGGQQQLGPHGATAAAASLVPNNT